MKNASSNNWRWVHSWKRSFTKRIFDFKLLIKAIKRWSDKIKTNLNFKCFLHLTQIFFKTASFKFWSASHLKCIRVSELRRNLSKRARKSKDKMNFRIRLQNILWKGNYWTWKRELHTKLCDCNSKRPSNASQILRRK